MLLMFEGVARASDFLPRTAKGFDLKRHVTRTQVKPTCVIRSDGSEGEAKMIVYLNGNKTDQHGWLLEAKHLVWDDTAGAVSAAVAITEMVQGDPATLVSPSRIPCTTHRKRTGPQLHASGYRSAAGNEATKRIVFASGRFNRLLHARGNIFGAGGRQLEVSRKHYVHIDRRATGYEACLKLGRLSISGNQKRLGYRLSAAEREQMEAPPPSSADKVEGPRPRRVRSRARWLLAAAPSPPFP